MTDVPANPPPPPHFPLNDTSLATGLAAALLPYLQNACQPSLPSSVDHDTAHTLLSIGKTVRTGDVIAVQPSPLASLPPHIDVPAGAPAFSTRRHISCVTYLKRLHVTSEMAAHLLPDMKTHIPLHAMRNMPNSKFFKRVIVVVDAHGRPHEISYDCLVSSGQRHARLSSGWSSLMRLLKASIGDTVVLTRYEEREKGVLHVSIEKGGG